MGNGAMKIDGAAVKRMIEEHDSTRRYEIEESSVQVVEVTDDVAIIAYKLRTIDGNATSEAYDTDVWVRRGTGHARCTPRFPRPPRSADLRCIPPRRTPAGPMSACMR